MKRVKRGGRYAKLPPGVRWVGRPSRWGNPFKVGSAYAVLDGVPTMAIPAGSSAFAYPGVEMKSADQCIEAYRHYAHRWIATDPKWLDPLRGATALACECEPGSPCHADVLIELLAKG